MYYVAGNNFIKERIGFKIIYEFNLVRPSGNKPCYITKNPNGLQTTSHHASLYEVKETKDGYELTRVQFRNEASPPKVVLSKYSDLWNYLYESIQYAETNNKFYE